MPHVPLKFRPVPGIAPSGPAALGLDPSAVLPPTKKKTLPKQTKPNARALRRISMQERPVSMGKWEVNPFLVYEELTGGSQI